MTENILDKVESITKPTYEKLKIWSHGFQHIKTVAKAAGEIAEMEGEDPILCQVAAYCHDLGRLEEEQRELVQFEAGSASSHAMLSVKPTQEILAKLNLTEDAKEKIIEAVQLHNIKKYNGENKILLILQDADRADGFNKFAILRFAHFNLEMEFPEPRDETEIDEKLKWVTDKIKKDKVLRDKMIHTLGFVMEWYEDLLNTKSAKILLKEGYEFIKSYKDDLSAE